jgi:hypothetical protein
VERGAALRLLETEAGLVPAELKTIQRQKGAYMEAVKALSEGRTEQGFRQFDELGWISEIPDADRYKQLATDYVSAVNAGKSALVVSPTHREGERVSAEIRWQLRREGKLGTEERQFRVLRTANLTTAERADAVNLAPGDIVVYHQNAKGIRKGERLVVGENPVLGEHADRFAVFRRENLSLARGDVIRITQNGKTADGKHRLNNGALFSVKNFTAKGDIRLTNGWTVAKDFGFMQQGYSLTSQASQGKTVDRVFVGISSMSFPASSREGFYVAASRARESARFYCDDKCSLMEAVSQSDDRISATEFLADREHRDRGEAKRRIERHKQTEREQTRPMPEKDAMMYER